MMEQRFTSKETSINKTKLPKIYKADIPSGSSVLDYGCGRYITHLQEKAKENGWIWNGYDPFNYPINRTESDYVLCSNVLNVIKEDEIVDDVIKNVVSLSKKAAIFTVYERDKSGVGCQTGEDQWQRNEKRIEYENRIRSLGYKTTVKKNMIWIYKEDAI